MAGDWIKMRLDLQTHPKIVRILSAMRPHDVQTRTDKFRVIGGLHAVWSVFDTHSSDGVLHGYTPEMLDHVIGWEGFSQAMMQVGWLEFDGAESIALPEFEEHNGQSAKRRGEDQKRKRDARRCPESVLPECGQNADKKRTREEKRREENKEEPKNRAAPARDVIEKPDDVVETVWADYLKLRKANRAPVTETSLDGTRKEAQKAGVSLEDALRICCVKGWRGFKADWVRAPPISANDARQAWLDELTGRSKRNAIESTARLVG